MGLHAASHEAPLRSTEQRWPDARACAAAARQSRIRARLRRLTAWQRGVLESAYTWRRRTRWGAVDGIMDAGVGREAAHELLRLALAAYGEEQRASVVQLRMGRVERWLSEHG